MARFELIDEDGNTVWVLEAQPPQSLDSIMYGEVPSGFTQLEPADGSLPRPLVPGELLTTETRTLKRLFIHTGVANSTTGMHILNYSMNLLEASD